MDWHHDVDELQIMNLPALLYRKVKTCLKLTVHNEWGRFYWHRRNTAWYHQMVARGLDLSLVHNAELGLDPRLGNEHCASAGPELRKVFDSLRIKQEDAIIDFGCGKGAALIVFASYPFARILGVEISPDLVRIARRNLELLAIKHVSMQCANALDISGFDKHNYYYFNNPFPDVVFAGVLDNIKASFTADRIRTIVYRNPVCHDLVVRGGFFNLHKALQYSDKPIHIYRSTST